MTATRRHRWVRDGFGLWRCTRRGCGLRRKDSSKSRDGWAYKRDNSGDITGRWYTLQQLGGEPVCVWLKR